MSQYKNKRIAIIGLSVEGIDSAEFFAGQGANITCCDRRTKEELGHTYTVLDKYSSTFALGPEYLDGLDRFDYIIRTPGMALQTPQLVQAKDHGSVVTSLTKVFFDECHCPIIGVTGTKGKGTTATLIFEMLRAAGKRVWLGGNVGTPLLSRVHQILPSDRVVLELSSFQLEDLHKSPHVAVVLKTTQEHLANFDPLSTNFHETKEAYVEAKTSIVKFQKARDVVIFNADDPTSTSFAKRSPAKSFSFSRYQPKADAFVADNTVILRLGKREYQLCSSADIQLIGMHNLENIAAASLAGSVLGVAPDTLSGTAKAFPGLEHRLERVRSIDGVEYVNDSFSTIPETTIAAIQSFNSPVILILGGSEKKSDFTDLGREITASGVKKVIVIGAMTDRILEAVHRAGYRGDISTGYTNMTGIVREARSSAASGDVVLLSPACASFDMFVNYKERGMVFKKEVMALT